MDISFFTNHGDLNTRNGYGIAGYNIVTSLQKLGHKIPWDDPSAPVQFNFCWPSFYADSLRSTQYQIGMTPWESTKFPEEWYDILHEVDELWATSEWNRQIYEDNGFNVTKVYHHGLDPMFIPKKRKIADKITFLYEGEAARKNGQFTFDAFKAAFGDDNDVHLIIKSKGESGIRRYNSSGNIIGYPDGNVSTNTKTLELEEMPSLYESAHVFVQHSAGEGFGIPGLQALGSGMPTMVTEACAPYAQYLQNLGVEASRIDSPWPTIHPGQVLQPSFDDAVDKLRYVRDNIESLADKFFDQAFEVHEEFDWKMLTQKAFNDVVTKFNT